VRGGYNRREDGLSGQFSGELEGGAPLDGISVNRGNFGISGGNSLSAEAQVFTGASSGNLATPGVLNDAEQGGGTIEGGELPQRPAVAEPKAHYGGGLHAAGCCFELEQQQQDQLPREEEELSWRIGRGKKIVIENENFIGGNGPMGRVGQLNFEKEYGQRRREEAPAVAQPPPPAEQQSSIAVVVTAAETTTTTTKHQQRHVLHPLEQVVSPERHSSQW